MSIFNRDIFAHETKFELPIIAEVTRFFLFLEGRSVFRQAPRCRRKSIREVGLFIQTEYLARLVTSSGVALGKTLIVTPWSVIN